MKQIKLILTPKFWIVISSFTAIITLSLILVISKCSMQGNNSESPITEFPSIKIEVINGCGISGVASQIRRFLSDKNIDVLNVSNARLYIYEETFIIVKHNDEEDLKRLKDITKIKKVVGESSGMVIYLSFFHALAPSIVAAS